MEVFRKKGVPQWTSSWLGNYLMPEASAGNYFLFLAFRAALAGNYSLFLAFQAELAEDC